MSNQTEPSITERLKHLRYPATYGHIKLVNASKWAADEIERLKAEIARLERASEEFHKLAVLAIKGNHEQPD